MFPWQRASWSNSSDQGNQLAAFDHVLDCARRGESEGLSTLYRQFLPAVFGYIAARVPDHATAEDLTSEVFLKMIEGISQIRANDKATFAAWLLQIARITVAGYYRKREKQPVLVSLAPMVWEGDDHDSFAIPTSHPDTDPVRWSEARDEWGTVVQAINTLTEEQRQVLIGRLILGYDVATVAQMIGKKANAVKALQFRALNSLQRLLTKKAASAEKISHSHAPHQEKAR